MALSFVVFGLGGLVFAGILLVLLILTIAKRREMPLAAFIIALVMELGLLLLMGVGLLLIFGVNLFR